MSGALLDLVTLSRGSRVRALLAGPGADYVHLIHVGVGWAYARLRLPPWTGNRAGHPLLRWLALDGWGFHDAFFHPTRVYRPGRTSRRPESVQAIHDQGAGRALWFYAGADPDRITFVIDHFPPYRREALWAGVGLAASYTGAQPTPVLQDLARLATGYHDSLAQGAAFAAKAQVISGQVPSDSAAAIELLTGVEPATAADWTDAALAAIKHEPDTPLAYEHWRAGIRHAWSTTGRLGQI